MGRWVKIRQTGYNMQSRRKGAGLLLFNFTVSELQGLMFPIDCAGVSDPHNSLRFNTTFHNFILK